MASVSKAHYMLNVFNKIFPVWFVKVTKGCVDVWYYTGILGRRRNTWPLLLRLITFLMSSTRFSQSGLSRLVRDVLMSGIIQEF